MGSTTLAALIAGVPIALIGLLVLIERWAKNRKRATQEERRRKNIAHERAWTLFRGRGKQLRLTHQERDGRGEHG